MKNENEKKMTNFDFIKNFFLSPTQLAELGDWGDPPRKICKTWGGGAPENLQAGGRPHHQKHLKNNILCRSKHWLLGWTQDGNDKR